MKETPASKGSWVEARILDSSGIGIDTGAGPETAGNPRSGFVAGKFSQDDSFLTMAFDIPESGYYRFILGYRQTKKLKRAPVWIDGHLMGEVNLPCRRKFTDLALSVLHLEQGAHTCRIGKGWGDFQIDRLALQKRSSKPRRPSFNLSDPLASPGARNLMKAFSLFRGKHFLAGQHMNSPRGDELLAIQGASGRLPALLGLDLLSYTPGIHSTDQGEHCRQEIEGNAGSVEFGLDWAAKGGIVTFCWHWFSPLAGRDKSFYTSNTFFDASRVLDSASDEYRAFMRDLDLAADQLARFAEKDIPVLWRPLHEAEGGWFWWGAKGSGVYKALYRLMYHHFVNVRGLHNLIWVWNAPDPDWYPGDDVVDIASSDHYSPAHEHGPLGFAAAWLSDCCKGKKPVAMGENGPIPDPALCAALSAPWLWWMTWWGMSQEGKMTSHKEAMRIYAQPLTLHLEAWKKFRRRHGL